MNEATREDELRFEMKEIIRYAFGQSSLGDFIAALSSKGLVAFEFADQPDAAVDLLRAHFPEAQIERGVEELGGIIEKLKTIVDHPGEDLAIVLDPRGTAYEQQVWGVLRQIPSGRTTSYGAVAAKMGKPGDARDVTAAIAANKIAILIPCHRVVKKDGSLSGYRWGAKRKRELLMREQQRDEEFRLE